MVMCCFCEPLGVVFLSSRGKYKSGFVLGQSLLVIHVFSLKYTYGGPLLVTPTQQVP